VSVESPAHGGAITLLKLTKRFGDFVAVDRIDLEAQPGEFLTLLGPSGSGKTTTLNMIAGFEAVTEGELLIDERAVHSLPPYKRDIGMVFQHYALFPHMTVEANVMYPLRQRKVAKDRRKSLVDAALEKVGLRGKAGQMPRQLSGGQQQRVALARAMVYQPQVLLMDEPLGALDKKLRDELQLEIKRIHTELGTTFVYVTHDQDEALVLSDRVAVFNEGHIEQVGTAKELYEHPETVFVAQFLGESSLFTGTAVSDRNGSGIQHDDVLLRGRPATVADGEAAALVLRPERIRVQPGDLSRPAGNAVAGRVRQEIYLGNSRKLEIEMNDGRPALVRETAGSVSDTQPGDQVWLTFRDEDAVILPARTGATNHVSAIDADEVSLG
jgi:putative spermidine/putrescine transport system ATP-binding protein